MLNKFENADFNLTAWSIDIIWNSNDPTEE